MNEGEKKSKIIQLLRSALRGKPKDSPSTDPVEEKQIRDAMQRQMPIAPERRNSIEAEIRTILELFTIEIHGKMLIFIIKEGQLENVKKALPIQHIKYFDDDPAIPVHDLEEIMIEVFKRKNPDLEIIYERVIRTFFTQLRNIHSGKYDK